jgi:hypothetical protein
MNDEEEYLINRNMIKDIIVYLKDGDKIREIERNGNVLKNQLDKINEQIEINHDIDKNKSINGNIAQIKYHDNLGIIENKTNNLKKQEYIFKKYILTEEYHKLCVEEDKHYNNHEVQEMIDYFLALDNHNSLLSERKVLDKKYEESQLQSQYLQLEMEISTIQKDIDLHSKAKDISENIKNTENQIKINNKQLTEQRIFERYLHLKDINQKLDNLAKNKETQITIDGIKQDLNDIQNDISMQESIYDEQNILFSKAKEELSLMDYELNKQLEIKENISNVERTLIKMEKDIVPYKEYNIIMGNKGITSKLLFNKIKSIEEYINSIIQTFTKYRINILYDEKKQTINMITENKNDENYLSTTRLSGYEKLMLQIAFKRALNKFSYNSKSSLIIIDEALDCIDQDNFLTKLPEVMNLITQDYSNCLAISQRDIAHISDHIVKIKKEQGCSIIY